MILAIDVGNSNVVIGVIEGERILRVFRMVTDLLKTEDEYAAGMKSILDFNGLDARGFDGAAISSVVPPLTNVFREAVRKLTGMPAFVVGSGIKTGLNILIDNPAELAADMVCSAVAAIAKYAAPAFIIDLGTATKITVIDKNGSYIGGAICPGVSLSADALARGASLLPKVMIEAPKKAICGVTTDAMKSGIVFGAAAMIDGMLLRFEEELGSKATVVATGGLAPAIVPHCRAEIVCDPNLILDGLRILFEKNKK
ncbi:MAG: type III pantothenate kinase [Oscillospiraceae bacterium]|jgi:type III pantothenate kinase|nr:type III pantothenate kinase [Oscillospiraceae bacterium]